MSVKILDIVSACLFYAVMVVRWVRVLKKMYMIFYLKVGVLLPLLMSVLVHALLHLLFIIVQLSNSETEVV